MLSFPLCGQVYERGTNVEQFVTRFLLKESANQIQSLLSSVESAVDAIDEQHSQSGWGTEALLWQAVYECAHEPNINQICNT